MSKYGDALDAMDQERERQAAAVAGVAQRYNPDQYAQAITRGAELDVPARIVADNPQAFERTSKYGQALDRQDAPTTREWMTNVDNAAVAQDDVESLTGLERALRAMRKGYAIEEDLKSAAKAGAVRAVGSSLSGLGRLLEAGAGYTARGIRAAGGDWLADALTVEAPWWLTPSEILKRPGAVTEGKAAEIDVPAERQNLATDIAGGVGQIGAQVVTQILTGGVGSTASLFGQGADIMGDRADAAGASPEQTDAAVLAGASITALTERYGLDHLLNRVPPQIKNAALRKLADIAAGGGIEAAQEAVEGILHNLTAKAVLDPSAPIFDGIDREAAAAGGAGALARAVLGAIIPGRQVSFADQDRATAEQIAAVAQQSKLATRSPQKLEELVSAIREQTGSEFAYIDPTAFRTLYQSDQEAAQAAAELTGSQTTYFEAAVSNSKIAVPIEKYVARIAANKDAQSLVDHVTFTPDGLTAEEAKTERELLEGRAKEIAEREVTEARPDSSQAVYEDVLGQLLGTGMERSTAEKNAALTQVVFRTLGQRTGVDAQQLYQRYGLKVQRQELEGVPGFDQTDGAKRGKIQFGPDRQFTISLLEKADLSTFQHESGHFYLEVLGDVAQDENAPQQVKDDYAAILKWMGVKDRASIQTDQHEQWARGFEAYLMEGKAPSVEMQSVFARFRAWLVSVYRTLAKLNVNLTDDVRRVMDRLVATDDEIAAAEESQNYAPIFTNAEEAGMSPEEWAAYKDIATRAHQEATQEMTDRIVKQLSREQKAWWKEERAKVRDEVLAEVNQQPIYRALAFLQKGTNADGSALAEGVQAAKLNKAALLDKYGKDFLKRLPRGLTAKDGLSADVAASLLGFDSGDALVEALANARPKNQLVEMEADARMREKYGDMLTDGSLAEQAMQSVHTEGRAKVMAAELKALNRKRREVKPFVKAAEQQARRERSQAREANYGNLLSKEQIREIREQAALQVSLNKDADANDYRRLADSAGKKAFDLATEGKIEDAVQYKRVEVLNRELYYAAIEAQEDAQKQRAKDEKDQQRQAREANAASLPDVDELKAIKAGVQRIIQGKKVRDIQPHLYRLAEARAARKAFELAGKGKYEEAYIEKRRQILNHELYRAAVKAREEIDGIVDYMRTFDKKATRERIAKAKGQFLEQIDALRERFDFSNVSNVADLKRDALSKWVAEQDAAGREVNVPEYLLNEARKTPYKELLLAELQGLHDAVANIEHLAKTKDRLLKNRAAVEWEQAKSDLLDRVQTALPEGKDPPLGRFEQGKLASLADHGRQIADSFLRPETIVEWLDGGTQGPWHDYLWNQANDSQDAREKLRDKVAKPLFDLAQKIDRKRRSQLQERVQIPSMGRALNRRTLISIALNMGNASNLDKLRRGGYRTKDGAEQFTDQNLQEIKDALTAEDWQFVQTVWDTVDQLWPDVVEFQKRMGGLAPEKVEATPVQTKHGDFRGGYFPVVYDPTVSTQGEKQVAGDSVGEIMGGDFTRASTKKGHTKTRTKVARPLLLDFERVVTRHMDQVITDLTHREFLLQALRILGDGELRAQIQNRIGEGAYRSLQGMVRHAVRADGQYGDPAATGWDKLQDHLIRNTAVAALGYRAVTAFGNLVLAPVQGAARISPSQILKGVGEFYRSPKQMTGFIHDRSEFMKQRATNMDQTLVETMASLRGERSILAQVARSAMAVHRWADFLGTHALWLAKYRESLESGKSDEASIREADKAIRQTQTAGASKDLSAFERDPRYKPFRLFLGPMIIMGNRIRESIQLRGVVKTWPEAFGTLMAVWFIPAVLWEIATGKGPDDDDDDGIMDDAALWALRKVFFYPFMTVPFLRDIASAVERKISGQYAPSRSVPLAEAGELVWKAGEEAYKAGAALYEGDDVDSEALVKDLLRASGPLVGLPSSQLSVTGQYLYDVATGEYDPEGVDDLRYLFVKRDSE